MNAKTNRYLVALLAGLAIGVVVSLLTGCYPAPAPTVENTIAPTQTPFVITATPEPTQKPTQAPTKAPEPTNNCLDKNELEYYIQEVYGQSVNFGYIDGLEYPGAWIREQNLSVLIGYQANDNGCIQSIGTVMTVNNNTDMSRAGGYLAAPAILLAHYGYDSDNQRFNSFIANQLNNPSVGTSNGSGVHTHWSFSISLDDSVMRLGVFIFMNESAGTGA